MSAYQATTASTAMLADNNSGSEEIFIQNRGPNSIYVDLDDAATVAGSVEVLANGGWISFRRPPNTAVNVICAVLQATPLDTRYLRAGG